MIKYLLTMVLLIAFTTQTLSGAFVKVSCFMNLRAYSQSCTTKAKPKLNCQRKCQVMQKMQEEENKGEENQENKITVLFSKLFFCNNEFTDIPAIKSINGKRPPLIKYVFLAVFHPPQV